MPFLLTLALKWGWSNTAARLFSWVAPIALALAVIGGTVFAIYHHGETAGSAKEQVKAEKAHTVTVETARADEKSAQATVDAIGASVARVDQKTTDLVRSKITEMHDAIDAPPAADAPAGLVTVDGGRVSASLNDLVAGANRSADLAEAQP